MAYTTIDKPSDHFDIVTYSGTGLSRTISYDFEVDFFWCKMRNDAYPHNVYDSSRGTNAQIRTDTNAAERSAANTVSFDNSSGVTLGTDGSNYGVNQELNDSSAQAIYVGYAWKANGGTTSTDTSGDIDGVIQVNQTAGISIVTFTSNGSSDQTVPHGLGAAPEVFWVKTINATGSWACYFKAIGETNYISLNATSALSDNVIWGDTAPTSTLLTIDTDSVAGGTPTMIAYCFKEIQGYSKFGSYEGNGNADGPFVYTGFKPAFLLYKNADDGDRNWGIADIARSTFNPVDDYLLPNLTNAEGQSDAFDFLSNGFKPRSTDAGSNDTDETIIYMAFAEEPFVTSGGVPATAR